MKVGQDHLSGDQQSGAPSKLLKTNPPIAGCLRPPVDNFYVGLLTSMICEVRLLIQGVIDNADTLQTIVIVATLVRVIVALRSHCQDSPQKSLVRHIVHS